MLREEGFEESKEQSAGSTPPLSEPPPRIRARESGTRQANAPRPRLKVLPNGFVENR